jgi:hypothetical protein
VRPANIDVQTLCPFPSRCAGSDISSSGVVCRHVIAQVGRLVVEKLAERLS